MHTTELEAMAKDMSSDLESQLQEGSEFLESQRDELVDIWNGRKIISYYATAYTPTVKPYATDLHQSQANECRRNGELAKMVKKVSAQLYLPNEYRIPVPHNHAYMVKFLAPSDSTYCSVASHIEIEVGRIRVERSMYLDECPARV